MRAVLLVPLLLAVSFAGCVDDDPSPAAGHGADGDLPELPVETRGRPADPDTGEVEAPEWRPGDWWRWSIEPQDHASYEARTAVARIEGGDYLVGWGDTETGLRSMFFHFVPHGRVAMDDLSWDAHDQPVQWLSFPLAPNGTYTGGFWVTELTFNVTEGMVPVPGGTGPGFFIEGTGAGGGVQVLMSWSNDLGMFTRLDFYLFGDEPWLVVRLLESGRGSTDPVHVLHYDLTLIRYTTLHHELMDNQAVPPVAEILEIPDGVTHVSMGCYLGGAPGAYRVRMTDSSGHASGCSLQGADDTVELQLAYAHTMPGTAVVEFDTVGEGSIFTELYLITEEIVTPVV